MTQDHRTPLSVSVVLPCYNEESSVGLCVAEALDTMRTADIRGEVVVVDNNCTDDSAAVATAAGARVVAEATPGYGSALRAGFRAAVGDIIIMADADFTYDLGKIPELIAPIVRDEADLVLGNRLDEATRQTMPFLHRFVGTPIITFLAAARVDAGWSATVSRVFARSDEVAWSNSGCVPPVWSWRRRCSFARRVRACASPRSTPATALGSGNRSCRRSRTAGVTCN